MPGLRRHSLNWDSINMDELKEKKTDIEISLQSVRKIRIIYDDPNATDSESDDDEYILGNENVARRVKRVVKEIVSPGALNRPASGNCLQRKSHGKKAPSGTGERKKEQESSRICRGVRKRKWGKYAAEIIDPVKHKRIWLGSFNTLEEAATVYQRKKLEFDRIQTQRTQNLSSAGALTAEGFVACSSVSESNVWCSHPSPSSVLDLAVSVPVVEGADNTRSDINSEKMVTADQPGSGLMKDPLTLPSNAQEVATGFTNQLQDGIHDAQDADLIVEEHFLYGGSEIREQTTLDFLADPVMPSSSINLESQSSFAQDMQYTNVMRRLSFEEDLWLNFSGELFHGLEEDLKMDFPELDEKELKWLDEMLNINEDLKKQ